MYIVGISKLPLGGNGDEKMGVKQFLHEKKKMNDVCKLNIYFMIY